MTLRGYCEQMGLALSFRRSNGGWACEITGWVLREERIPASALGKTRKKAYQALAELIAGHVLQQIDRPTTLYWVPPALAP